MSEYRKREERFLERVANLAKANRLLTSPVNSATWADNHWAQFRQQLASVCKVPAESNRSSAGKLGTSTIVVGSQDG
jgi:hypothetical protein